MVSDSPLNVWNIGHSERVASAVVFASSRPVHNRMPVLLHEEDYDVWLRGSLEDVMAFQGRCFPDELTVMERTQEPWFRRREAAGG